MMSRGWRSGRGGCVASRRSSATWVRPPGSACWSATRTTSATANWWSFSRAWARGEFRGGRFGIGRCCPADCKSAATVPAPRRAQPTMTTPPVNIALFYDDAAYVEKVQASRPAVAGAPVGLMGRQVAGKEFLDAYFTHGTWDKLVAVVCNQPSIDSLIQFARTHPSSQARQRHIQLAPVKNFHRAFFPTPPAPLLYTPMPPDPSYAWVRQHGGAGAAAPPPAPPPLRPHPPARALCGLPPPPYEPFDSLICTSSAVVDTVRKIAGTFADYLRERHGGRPALRLQTPVIPLGVNTDRFRPPTPEQRATQRQRLQVADDEVAVLFVGRLSFPAQAHPYPMFQGLAHAARATGVKAHLILAGWFGNAEVEKTWREGIRALAPGVRVSVVDATQPDTRFAVWHAADVFTSLSDNIQETFGLAVVEAMACGLPVVATDWNGYRDLVADGETGYLVPTYVLRDATADTTS